MDQPLTEEESYADRRQLFKHIWDTETIEQAEEKSRERKLTYKPKIIRTLRLDEAERISKKKKQRIKNLRIVCDKILDFCDRQDADDMFYAQMSLDGRMSPIRKKKHRIRKKSMDTKTRKIKISKTMFRQEKDALQTGTTSLDPFVIFNKSLKMKGASLGVQENYRKKVKVPKFPVSGVKVSKTTLKFESFYLNKILKVLRKLCIYYYEPMRELVKKLVTKQCKKS